MSDSTMELPDGNRYGDEPVDASERRKAVAGIMNMNPELVQGYLVVAQLIDGQLAFASNTCCISHMLYAAVRTVSNHPELFRKHGHRDQADS